MPVSGQGINDDLAEPRNLGNPFGFGWSLKRRGGRRESGLGMIAPLYEDERSTQALPSITSQTSRAHCNTATFGLLNGALAAEPEIFIRRVEYSQLWSK